MEDIIKKIKDHPQFIFADSDDELISIIDEVNPGLTRDQKFDIIDDLEKLGRSGSRRRGSRRGGIQDEIKNYLSGTNYATSEDDDEVEGILDNLSVYLQYQGYSAEDAENGIGYYQDPYDSYQEPKLGSRKGQDFTAQGIQTVANAFKDVTTKKIPDAIGKLKKERDGSRKGSTVQQIIDAFDRDCVPHGELIRMAKELPDGLGDRVLIGLGAGSWRGDTPEEEEFFRIIDSKCSRNGSSVRKGTGPLCDLGSVSGKGSRPENLGSIASKVALGRNRSINMDGEYNEQESRKGSYGEDPLAQQIIGDNVEEDSDGYNFYDARNALRLEGYSEDEIEDNIDTWMYQHMN